MENAKNAHEHAQMVGAYTAFSTQISAEQMKVFNHALHGLEGVKYTPLAVSSQVVAGMNYKFFCNAKGVYPHAINEGVLVTIYQPLEGHPHITSITKCH